MGGYLTTESAADTYATKDELDGYATDADISGMLTSADLAGYAKTAEVAGTYATKESLAGYATTESLSGYATTAALTSGLAGKLDSSALTGYATESYVDTATADMLTKGVADKTYAGIDTETVANNAATHAQQALTDIGTKSELTTENKDNLVGAINELDKAIGGMAADGTVQQIQEDLSTLTGRVGTNAAAIGTVANLATGEKTNLVGAVNEVFGAVNDATDDLGALTERVDANESGIGALTTTVGNAESGLVKSVKDLSTSVATNTSGISDLTGRVSTAESDIDTLQSGKADKSTSLAGYGITNAYTKTETDNLLKTKEDAANKLVTITEADEEDTTKYPSVGAMVSWTEQRISGLSELPVNPDLINPGTIKGDKLESGAITTDKIANGAVTDAKLSEELNAEIDGKLPRPPASCMAESGLCVLTVTKEGDLAWTNVTAPAD